MAAYTPAVEYRQALPGEPLRAYVESYWFLSGPRQGPGDAVTARPIFPDGSMEIVLNLDDPFEEVLSSEEVLALEEVLSPSTTRLQPLAMVAGQMTRPVVVRPTGGMDLVGIRLRPAACKAVLGSAAPPFRDSLVELTSISSRRFAGLRDRVGEAPRGGREEALDRALLELVRTAPATPSPIAWAARELQERSGRVSVDHLARGAGLGPRQLERLFHDWVGLSPKLLSRILRFQVVLQTMATGDGDDWAAVAVENGYYDQSHLARDFRSFTGEPPARALEALDTFTATFLRSPRGPMSGSSKTRARS